MMATGVIGQSLNMDDLRKLWTGEMPLRQAFWEFFLLYGGIINTLALIVAFGILSADGPPAVAVAVLVLPAPYVIFSAIGAWRSAGAYQGPPHRAAAAKAATLVLAVLMIVL